MTQTELEELKDAIHSLGEAFHTIEATVNMLPQHVQQEFRNPESLGPIAAFLGLGRGYEPAVTHGGDCEQLIAIAEEYVIMEDDEGNAGCDACGNEDRLPGEKFCEGCIDEQEQ